MPPADIIQTFAGITHENEFYSHHYLSEVFRGDIRARLDAWRQTEEEGGARSPQNALRACGRSFKTRLMELQHRASRRRASELPDLLALQQGLHAELLSALGYAISPQEVEIEAGLPHIAL